MNKKEVKHPVLKRGLIVSCQAAEGEVFHGLNIMKYMARAAVLGGAKGIRTSSVEDIEAIRKETDLPIIGLIKRKYNDSDIFITPTLREVKKLSEAPCDVIALDVTDRKRPGGETVEDLVEYIREANPDIEIMADCSNYEEAKFADGLGFDYIGTTMCGVTDYTKNMSVPNYELLKKMRDTLEAKVIAEGGIWEISQLEKALEQDPYAVVIGTAITRPMDITQRFNSVFGKFGM